jgi:serine/threonine-protein kinase
LLVAVAALSSVMTYEVGARRAVSTIPRGLHVNIDPPLGVNLSLCPSSAGPGCDHLSESLALSPDGSKLAIVGDRDGNTQLYLRSTDQDETRPIEGTERARAPFFSPDGQWIGFWADGHLKKWPLVGGKPTTICDTTAVNGAAWLSDDLIVVSTRFGLQRCSVREGQLDVIATLNSSQGETFYGSPVALPGGNAVMFSIRYGTKPPRMAVFTLNNGEKKTLPVTGAEQPRFIAPGFMVVNRGGTLEVAPFDTARLEVNGPLRPLGEGASMAGAQSMTGAEDVVSYDVAAAGHSLVYVKAHSTEAPRLVYSLDLHGKPEVLSLEPRPYGDAALSPDGNKIAVDVNIGPGVSEIWVLDLVHKGWRPLTTGQNDWTPAWQDDDTLIYLRGREDNRAITWDVLSQSTSSNATPTRLAFFPHRVFSSAVAPNHGAVVFRTGPPSFDLWTQPLGRDGKDTDRQAEPLVASPYVEGVLPCGFSPDSRWLVYVSDKTERREIYVTDVPARSAPHAVTNAGGSFPCWSKNGDQIFYWHDNTVMAVTVQAGATFTAGTPHKLFDAPVTPRWGYDVARDGTFYLAGNEIGRTSPIVFVSDITADLPSSAKAK